MKKLINLILILCLILGMQSTVYAASTLDDVTVGLNKDSDIKTVLGLMDSDETMEFVSIALMAENIDIDKAEEISWTNVQKVYTDVEVLPLNSESKIENLLNDSSYFYVASVFVDDVEVEVYFTKGLPPRDGIEEVLTETEYQNVLNNVGRWHASSVGVVPDDGMSIHKALEQKVSDDYEKTMVVMGLQGLDYPVVIGFNNQIAMDVILVYDESVYDAVASNEKNIGSDGVYGFEELMKVAANDKYKNHESDVMVEPPAYVDNNEEVVIEPKSVTGYKQLNVIKFYQEKTRWCWAACAKMLGKYISNRTLSQSNIVQYIMGNTENVAATNEETRSAISYAVGGSYVVTVSGTKSYTAIYNMVYTKARPFVMKILKSNGGAHVYVVSGVSGGTKLYLMDPVEGIEPRWYDYDSLINGTSMTGISGTGTYSGTYFVN